ncbi:U-box domain-containing protein 43 [Rhynchospora pubera]|uniref:RING-type E3 ubiquitin transferase n=1 Tax=Rhynchospora pubera TaxID=906938 RepID=A0AAV8GT33_9POAL|nr:U-box domain-containing protein 43 [Rhynchospora pubera]
MESSLSLSFDSDEQSSDNYEEKAFDAFTCPLTRQVMWDPVTIESGQTFEREAIIKWFKECRENGRNPTCPLTQIALKSTELTPCIALRKAIEEWRKRREERELEKAQVHLTLVSSEQNAVAALRHVITICQRNEASKDLVRNQGLIPMIVDMLRSSNRQVRLKALEALRVIAEENDDNKETVSEGDTIRTIIKFLSNEYFQERALAVTLLYELSTLEPLCEKIGAVYGAILILVGMASSKAENIVAVEKAESTLKNLEKCEANIKPMAENGRLMPLLKKLLKGTPEVQLSMIECLSELVLANDAKATVASKVGPILINIMQTGTLQAREATLKALKEISSNEASSKTLIEAGIFPPLINDLFSVGVYKFPMRLKELSASILANLVNSDAQLETIAFEHNGRMVTLLSEDVVHSLLHLISNTGPAIECRLLQVLVGMTNSAASAKEVVAAVRSSGAIISLIQFIEAVHRDIRVAALKLLGNISSYMGPDLSDALGGSTGHLSSLMRVISDTNIITEEQTAAVKLLADLPEREPGLTRQLFDLGAFQTLAIKLSEIKHGVILSNRHVTIFQEGIARILCRITYGISEPDYLNFAMQYDLGTVFLDLLQTTGQDNLQIVSATVLENLSQESKNLTRVPELPPVKCCQIFSKPAPVKGLCRVHHGFCSMKDTFCLLQGRAVERLIACLDHQNEKVVEASLGALCTLLSDGVDIIEGVFALYDAEGIRPILDVLVENRSREVRQKAVWAVERILRIDDIAREVSSDQSIGSALVEAFRTGDYKTRQIAERALKHVDKLPSFSSAYHQIQRA